MPRGIGDTVFTPNGVPGVITERNVANGKFKVETDGPAIRSTQNRGYINGLSVDQRRQYNEVIDRVSEIKDPAERVNELVKVIQDLDEDPKSFTVKRYLESELAHLRISYNIKPKSYQIPSIDVQD